MAAITAPYSLEIEESEDARDITAAGTVATIVADHLKIFLGADVDVTKCQTIVGSLDRCFRVLKNEQIKVATNADLVAYGDYAAANESNITVAGTIAGLGDSDVAVVLSDTFTASANTHFVEESFRQLINKFIENSKET